MKLKLENRGDDETPGPPDDVVHGLALLLRFPPLWPVPFAQWRIAVERVEAYAYAHDCEARAAGWSDLQLHGLHPHAPCVQFPPGRTMQRRPDRTGIFWTE